MQLLRRLLPAAALAACCLFAFLNLEHLVFSAPGVYALSAPANVRADGGGGLLVVDGGNSVVLRADREGTVNLLLQQSEFDAAVDAAGDAEGNLYLLDLARTGSRQLLAERVLLYSPDGRFVEEVYRCEHGPRDNQQRLVHISCEGDRLVFVELREQSFVVHSREGAGELRQREWDYPEALSLIWQFAAGPEGLVGLDKQGRIFRVGEDGVETLYAAADFDTRSIPGDIAVGPDGVVYLTDLGLRQIARVEQGAQIPLYIGEADFSQRVIYTRLDAVEGGLAASSEYGLLLLNEGGKARTEQLLEQFPVSSALLVRRVLVWCALGLAAVLLLRFLWLGACALRRHRGRVLRVSVAVLSGALLLSTVFSLIVMRDINGRLIREKLSRLTTAAQLTARQVPIDAFEGVEGVGDYLGEDYRRVQDAMREIFLGESGLQADMYGILYRVLDGVVTIIYATEENTSLYPYDWEVPGSDMERILLTGVGVESTDYASSEGEFLFTLQPVFDGDGRAVGIIEMGADLGALHRENRAILFELYLNILSVSVVIVLVVTELAVFLEGRRERADAARAAAPGLPAGACVPVGVARMGVFLVIFVANMCTAFLPLYARSILPASAAAGNWYEQLVALPLSADVLFGALAVLFGHRLNRRLGTRRTGLLAAVLFMAGMALKCIPRYGALIAGSAVFGLGWGLLLLLCNLNMAAQPGQEMRNSGFAGYTASMLSGVNCGVVVGSFLLNWLSYSAVICVSAVLGLLVPAFVLCYFRGLSLYEGAQAARAGHMGALRFLRTPRVLLFFLTLVLPMLACGYFLGYLFPIVGYDLGISEVNIGYAFLLYNLFVVCFGRVLMTRLTRRAGKIPALLLWGAVYVGAFLLFAHFRTVPALLGALALLGLSDGFGLPLYTSYYTDLPQVAAFGQDRAIGMLGVAENIAQTAGPFLFSMVLRPGGWRLEWVAAGLLLAVLVFAVCSLPGQRRDRQATREAVRTR